MNDVRVTVYEPGRRWFGRRMCRIKIEIWQPWEKGWLIQSLHEGWVPDTGIGYCVFTKGELVEAVT